MNLHTPWYASKFIKLTFITPNTLYNSKVVPGNMSFFRLVDFGTKTILNDIVDNFKVSVCKAAFIRNFWINRR